MGRANRSWEFGLSGHHGRPGTQSKLSGLCCSPAGRGYGRKQRLSVQAEKLWQGQAEPRQLQINYYNKSSDSDCVKEQPLIGQVQVTYPECWLHWSSSCKHNHEKTAMRKKALAIFSYLPLSFSLNTRAKAINAVPRPQAGPFLWGRKPLLLSLLLHPCTLWAISVALCFLACAMGRTGLTTAKCSELFCL